MRVLYPLSLGILLILSPACRNDKASPKSSAASASSSHNGDEDQGASDTPLTPSADGTGTNASVSIDAQYFQMLRSMENDKIFFNEEDHLNTDVLDELFKNYENAIKLIDPKKPGQNQVNLALQELTLLTDRIAIEIQHLQSLYDVAFAYLEAIHLGEITAEDLVATRLSLRISAIEMRVNSNVSLRSRLELQAERLTEWVK